MSHNDSEYHVPSSGDPDVRRTTTQPWHRRHKKRTLIGWSGCHEASPHRKRGWERLWQRQQRRVCFGEFCRAEESPRGSEISGICWTHISREHEGNRGLASCQMFVCARLFLLNVAHITTTTVLVLLNVTADVWSTRLQTELQIKGEH